LKYFRDLIDPIIVIYTMRIGCGIIVGTFVDVVDFVVFGVEIIPYQRDIIEA
jgi:hypothetical protein